MQMAFFSSLLLWSLSSFLTSCGVEHQSNLNAIIGGDNREQFETSPIAIVWEVNGEAHKPICAGFASSAYTLLTASHCLKESSEYRIMLRGREYEVTSYQRYPDADVASMELKTSIDDELVLRINYDADPNTQLSTLYGFEPEKGFFRVESGEMSRAYDGNGTPLKGAYFHTFDTVPGSSGSPILNSENEVIALHIAEAVALRNGASLNIAVSVRDLEQVNVSSLFTTNVRFETAGMDYGSLKQAYEYVKQISPGTFSKVEQYILKKATERSPVLVSQLSRWGTIIGGAVGTVGLLLLEASENISLGIRLDQSSRPFSDNRYAINALVFNNLRVGDNEFAGTDVCAQKMQSTTALSSKVFLPVTLKPIETNKPIGFPIKLKVRVFNLCGIQYKGNQISAVGRTPMGDAGVPPIARKELLNSPGVQEFEFVVNREVNAISIQSSQFEWGKADDFHIEKVEIEIDVSQAIALHPESAWCELKFYDRTNFGGGRCKDISIRQNDIGLVYNSYENGSGSWAPCSDVKSVSFSCDKQYHALFCNERDQECIYRDSPDISDFPSYGIGKLRHVKLCSNPDDCKDKVLAEGKVPTSVAISELIIAGFTAKYFLRNGRYPNAQEIEAMAESFRQGNMPEEGLFSDFSPILLLLLDEEE